MKTLKNLKVGDTAYDVVRGEVTCVGLFTQNTYPIRFQDKENNFHAYTVDGKSYTGHENPSLYLTNPFQQQSKWMMVSDDNINWKKRFVIAEKCGKFVAWNDAETDEEVLTVINTSAWRYAKEIEEETIPEYTMEELVAKLGNFKIKK